MNSEDPLNALCFVRDLQKKGRVYLDQLLRDLLKLDAVSGGNVRSERKKQVFTTSFIL